ncbi:MAG TPA: hypothetical protein VMV49_01510 [Candidatus Deferrimicrobium sp.]|nr:hypothetical protein [Candidatus Deferrimicrobium sp.]
MILYNIIIGVSAGIISIILAIFIIRTYFLTKIKATIIFFVLFCLTGANTFTFAFLTFVSPYSESLALGMYVFIILTAFFSPIFICIFFDYIELGQLRTNTTYFFGILIGAFFSVLCFSNQIPDLLGLVYSIEFSSWMVNLDNYLRMLIMIFGVIVIYRLIKGFISIQRVTTNKNAKFQFKIINFGIIFGLVGLFFSSALGVILSTESLILGSFLRASYPLFIAVGLLIIFIGFKLNPYSIYLISQKVFEIIVFNIDGLTIFNQKFQLSTSKHATLITGAIFGVSSMIQHALGIESVPRSLKFKDRIILFEFKDTIGFALISDRNSRILRNGLRNFADLFMKTYKNDLKNWNGQLKPFKNASEFIKISFPFLSN